MPIYEEKDKINGQKRWFIRTYITDENNKKKQITRHNKDWIGREGFDEARREEIRLRSSKLNREYKKLTLKQLKDKYLESLKGKVDNDTLDSKITKLYHFCEIDKSKQITTYPNKFLEDFDKNIYQTWQNQMRNKTFSKGKTNKSYSLKQLNNIHREICLLLDYAIINGYCRLNFAKQCGKIGSPKEIKMSNLDKIYEVLTYDEYLKLLEVSKDNLKYNTYFDLSFTRGPRPGEMRAFRIKDYDYDKKQLMVNHTMSKKNKLKYPKTKSSKSPIDIDDEVNNKINKLIEQLKQKKDFNSDWYIFNESTPISENAIRNARDKYLKKANINKHIRLHDFRHSCATWLFSIGTPVTVISKILRHANINETLKTYTHLLKEDYINELKKIDNLRKQD